MKPLCAEVIGQKFTQHPDDLSPAVFGGLALLHLGGKGKAKAPAARAEANENEDPVSLYNLACVYSHLGESDAAFDLLERAVTNRHPFWKDWIENDSDLDEVRDHPRYGEIIALLGETKPHL